MAQRQDKKFRKEVRRRVDANFGEGMAAFSNIVRPRPRLIPKWLWILAYAPIIPTKYLRLIYKHMN